jgi:hypothetical protein
VRKRLGQFSIEHGESGNTSAFDMACHDILAFGLQTAWAFSGERAHRFFLFVYSINEQYISMKYVTLLLMSIPWS